MLQFRRGAGAAYLMALVVALVALVAAAEGRAFDNRLFVNPPTSTPSDTLFTVDLCRNAGDEVQGFDVRIVFDHRIVRLTSATPGDWLTGPLLPFALYNTTAAGEDTIRLSAAFLGLGRSSGLAGVVATLHFEALKLGVSPLEIVFLAARDAGNADVPFGHSTGDRIIIDRVIAAEAASLGRVKALYGGR